MIIKAGNRIAYITATKGSVRKRFTKLYKDSAVQLLADNHELILCKTVAEEMRKKATDRLSAKKKRKAEEVDSD